MKINIKYFTFYCRGLKSFLIFVGCKKSTPWRINTVT